MRVFAWSIGLNVCANGSHLGGAASAVRANAPIRHPLAVRGRLAFLAFRILVNSIVRQHLRFNLFKHSFFVSLFPYLMAVMGKSNQLAVFVPIQVLA